MIDLTRSTEAERNVLDIALERYESVLTHQAADHPSHSVRNRAQWRLYVVQVIRQQLAAW